MGFIGQRRIKHLAPPKGQVAGSNPAWDTNEIIHLQIYFLTVSSNLFSGDNHRDNQSGYGAVNYGLFFVDA